MTGPLLRKKKNFFGNLFFKVPTFQRPLLSSRGGGVGLYVPAIKKKIYFSTPSLRKRNGESHLKYKYILCIGHPQRKKMIYVAKLYIRRAKKVHSKEMRIIYQNLEKLGGFRSSILCWGNEWDDLIYFPIGYDIISGIIKQKGFHRYYQGEKVGMLSGGVSKNAFLDITRGESMNALFNITRGRKQECSL